MKEQLLIIAFLGVLGSLDKVDADDAGVCLLREMQNALRLADLTCPANHQWLVFRRGFPLLKDRVEFSLQIHRLVLPYGMFSLTYSIAGVFQLENQKDERFSKIFSRKIQ